MFCCFLMSFSSWSKGSCNQMYLFFIFFVSVSQIDMAQSLQSFFPSTVRDPQHAKEPTIALGNPHAIYKTSQPKTNPLLVLDRRFVHQILPTVFEVLNTMSTGDYKVSRPSFPFPVLFCPVLSCPGPTPFPTVTLTLLFSFLFFSFLFFFSSSVSLLFFFSLLFHCSISGR